MNHNAASSARSATTRRYNFTVRFSCEKRDYETFIDRFFRFLFILIVFITVFTFSIPAAENGVSQDSEAPAQFADRLFEVIDLTWDDFSFKIPLPIGETYKILRGDDKDGFDNFTIITYRDDIAHIYYSLSTRSLRKDDGHRYREMKEILLFSELHSRIEDRISQTLMAKNFLPQDYKRVEKVCDSDYALIYQSEVPCIYGEYLMDLFVAIGTTKHDSYSSYFISIDFLANIDGEWDTYFLWNKHLAEFQ